MVVTRFTYIAKEVQTIAITAPFLGTTFRTAPSPSRKADRTKVIGLTHGLYTVPKTKTRISIISGSAKARFSTRRMSAITSDNAE